MGKNSQKTTSQTVYGNTKTTNPYAYAKTNNKGTISGFQDGTALNSVYNFVNRNIDSMLNDYLNPNLNSTTNQARINAFTKNLNQQTRSNLENNIINPLSQRNMLRSSQASDLYKNLSNQNVASLDNYITNLLSQAQDNSASMLNNLFKYYMNGYDVLSDMQNQSLRTSAGNATNTRASSVSGTNIANPASQAADIVLQMLPYLMTL